MSKLLSIILTIFLVPTIASAAWWNPFTWFQKEKAEIPKTVNVDKEWYIEYNNVMTKPTTTPEEQAKPSVKPVQTIKPTPKVVPVVKVEAQANLEQVNQLIAILERDSEFFKEVHNDLNTIFEISREDLVKFSSSKEFEKIIDAVHELNKKAEFQQSYIREILAYIQEIYNVLNHYKEQKVTLTQEELDLFVQFYTLKRKQYLANEKALEVEMENYYSAQAGIVRNENKELQKDLDAKRKLMQELGITE